MTLITKAPSSSNLGGPRREGVCLHVVDGNEGQAVLEGEELGKVESGGEGPAHSRPGSHGDQLDAGAVAEVVQGNVLTMRP